MLRLLIPLVLVIVAAPSVRAQRLTPAAQARQTADPFDQAAATITAEMEKGRIPGAAVAVVRGDQVIWAKGFGVANLETGTPVTPDTLFQIGSVTKSFTAAAVLAASRDGLVTLDSRVGTHVSGLTPCVGAPTLSQLLSHTGGLIDEPDEFGTHGEDGLGAYQRTWKDDYCLLPPGRAFSYSNSGFALAGLAVQEAEKKPFADVMRTRVLAPLGMTRTTFRPTEAMTWPLAVGHRRTKDGALEVVRPLPNDARLWPAGTMYSSANEMARFLMAMTHDGRVDGRQGLPAGVVATIRAKVADIPTTSQGYGQGAFLGPRPGDWGHGGTMTGYVAQDVVAGEGNLAVVVLTNGDNANTQPLVDAARSAAERLAPAGTRRDVPATATDPPPASSLPAAQGRGLTAAQADGYVGRYSNPRRFTVEVVRSGLALTLKRFGRDFPMTYVAPGLFTVALPRGGTETIAFGLGADGRVDQTAGGRADYLQMNVWALARVPDPKP